jgi:hypothetical protein
MLEQGRVGDDGEESLTLALSRTGVLLASKLWLLQALGGEKSVFNSTWFSFLWQFKEQRSVRKTGKGTH